MSTFVVVEFIEEKCVEIVPQTWIETINSEFYCFWPRTNIQGRVKKLELPDKTNWSKYRVRIFAYADNYNKAVKIVKKAEVTSNVESSESESGDERPLKRIRKTVNYVESEQGEDQTVAGTNLHEMMPPRRKKKTSQPQTRQQKPTQPKRCEPSLPCAPEFQGNISHSNPGSNEPMLLSYSNKENWLPLNPSILRASQVQSNQDPFCNEQLGNQWGTTCVSKALPPSHVPLSENPFQFSPPLLQDDSFAEIINDFSRQNEGNLSTNRSFQTNVLVKLDTIMENQKEIMVLLRRGTNIGGTHTVDIQKNVLPKPMDTEVELNEFCSKLNDESFSMTMITYLSSQCGHNIGDTVRRIMAKLGTYKLWSCYSFLGRKQKLAFKDIRICDCIKKACLKSHKNINEMKIEEQISETMRHAPYKPGGSRYRNPKEDKEGDN